MKKQSLLEYMKDNLDDTKEWLKTIWIFFLCVAILILITAVLTFLFILVLYLFIPIAPVISLLGSLFALAVLLCLMPIALTVFEYFIDM